MPDNKVASLRGTAALSVDLGLEKGMKKRQILLGQKVKPVKIQNFPISTNLRKTI